MDFTAELVMDDAERVIELVLTGAPDLTKAQNWNSHALRSERVTLCYMRRKDTDGTVWALESVTVIGHRAFQNGRLGAREESRRFEYFGDGMWRGDQTPEWVSTLAARYENPDNPKL